MRLVWLFIPLLLGFGPFESPGGLVEEGNALFSQGKYDEAKEKYDRALKLAGKGAPIMYNRANALFKKGDLEGALKDYREGAAAGDDALKAKSYYNMGNALYAGQNFHEAAASYREALKHNPEDTDAKMNLELALKKMEEQKQKRKKESKDDNREDKDKGGDMDDRKRPQEETDNNKHLKDSTENENPAGKEEDGEKREDERSPRMNRGGKGKMSREEAERLLENLGDRNMDLQTMTDMLKGSEPARVEKDW